MVRARREVCIQMCGAAWIALAVGFLGACGSTERAGPVSASSMATPTSPVTTATSTPAPPTSSPPEKSELQESAGRDAVDVVIAAVLHRLYGATGMSDPPVVDQVNLVDRYGTRSASGQLDANGRAVEQNVRAALEQALTPSAVVWVNHWSDVIGDVSSATDETHPNVVVLLTFGEPVINDGTATIDVDMVCGSLCGRGATYDLQRSEVDEWVVLATTDHWVA